jgi:hypothetical protein
MPCCRNDEIDVDSRKLFRCRLHMLQPVSTELQKLNTVEDGRDEGVREERERMSYLAVSVEA